MSRIRIRTLNRNMRMDARVHVVKKVDLEHLVHWGPVVAQVEMVVKVHKGFVVSLVFKVSLEILRLHTRLSENLAKLENQELLEHQDNLVKLVDKVFPVTLEEKVFPELKVNKVNPAVPVQLVQEETAVGQVNRVHVVRKGRLVLLVLGLRMFNSLTVIWIHSLKTYFTL